MFLHGDSVYLRALEPTDLEFLYELENDTTLWPVSDTRVPFSKFVLQEYLDHAATDIYTVRQLRLVICLPNHQPIGTIDLFDFEPAHRRAGVGVVIGSRHRQKGYAKDALGCLLSYCRDLLHLHQLHCSITADNLASHQLFGGLGFGLVGIRKDWLQVKGKWVDVAEYQKLLNP